MQTLIIALVTGALYYLIGSFSYAKLVARKIRYTNITMVGTGHPDTENVFLHVHKGLGIALGLVDFGKTYCLLWLAAELSRRFYPPLHATNWLMVLGFITIVGHCLPAYSKFRGGRGIFTYMGFVAWFAFWPMAIVALMGLVLEFLYKQTRFVQFLLVLAPPFLVHFFNRAFLAGYPDFGKLFLAAALMGVLNVYVAKRKGDF